MARGPSGRFVVELDPGLKRELHSALAADGLSLKDWFRTCADAYLQERSQPSLTSQPPDQLFSKIGLRAAESRPHYRTDKDPAP